MSRAAPLGASSAAAAAGGSHRHGGKTHFTFDDRRLEDIGRENVALLNRLSSVATRRVEVGKPPAVLKLAESSASRNRRKQAAEVEELNRGGREQDLLSGGGKWQHRHTPHRTESSASSPPSPELRHIRVQRSSVRDLLRAQQTRW
jgi:hypothetical protein